MWSRDIPLWKGGWIMALVFVQLVVSPSLTVRVEWCLPPRIVVIFGSKFHPAQSSVNWTYLKFPISDWCNLTCIGKIRDRGKTFMKTLKPNSSWILREIGTQVDHYESVQWRVLSLCFWLPKHVSLHGWSVVSLGEGTYPSRVELKVVGWAKMSWLSWKWADLSWAS